MKNLSISKRAAIIVILFSQQSLMAQDASTTAPVTTGFSTHHLLNYGLGFLIVLLFILVLYQLSMMQAQVKYMRHLINPSISEDNAEGPSWLDKMIKKLSGLKPMEMEKDLIIENHEYDGIQELNNGMPPWLRYFFISTILFAVVYMVYYMILGIGPDQIKEYENEMTIANQQKEERMKLAANKVDENTVTFISAEADLMEGKNIYKENCATCHADLGGGGAGPNLTDEYWIHGGGIKNIFKTVKYGFPEKGMATWKDKLTPSQMQKVASYILSLQGTNPPNALPPAGEKWTENVSEIPASDSVATIVSDTLASIK